MQTTNCASKYCQSLQKKSHYNTWRLRSPLLAAPTSRLKLTFKFLTLMMESLYNCCRYRCIVFSTDFQTMPGGQRYYITNEGCYE
jgi:hypothetical protein